MQQDPCQECDRTWREYSRATSNHVKLLMESQLATIEGDNAAGARLETLILEAEKERVEGREKLRRHEASHNWKLRGFDLPKAFNNQQ